MFEIHWTKTESSRGSSLASPERDKEMNGAKEPSPMWSERGRRVFLGDRVRNTHPAIK
ncbi:hypothetical protein RvY_13122 [Ramazzottius varieornatus]|uniref:Uncharacterized protein n=1 Tax=Ramazzottius varieornatus TaxID=947166 RepID=A0A1D1VS66_RAMVA|nr:hypothetical protein RvY_13122 [Ramazzottius varieornatus]